MNPGLLPGRSGMTMDPAGVLLVPSTSFPDDPLGLPKDVPSLPINTT